MNPYHLFWPKGFGFPWVCVQRRVRQVGSYCFCLAERVGFSSGAQGGERQVNEFISCFDAERVGLFLGARGGELNKWIHIVFFGRNWPKGLVFPWVREEERVKYMDSYHFFGERIRFCLGYARRRIKYMHSYHFCLAERVGFSFGYA